MVAIRKYCLLGTQSLYFCNNVPQFFDRGGTLLPKFHLFFKIGEPPALALMFLGQTWPKSTRNKKKEPCDTLKRLRFVPLIKTIIVRIVTYKKVFWKTVIKSQYHQKIIYPTEFLFPFVKFGGYLGNISVNWIRRYSHKGEEGAENFQKRWSWRPNCKSWGCFLISWEYKFFGQTIQFIFIIHCNCCLIVVMF